MSLLTIPVQRRRPNVEPNRMSIEDIPSAPSDGAGKRVDYCRRGPYFLMSTRSILGKQEYDGHIALQHYGQPSGQPEGSRSHQRKEDGLDPTIELTFPNHVF